MTFAGSKQLKERGSATWEVRARGSFGASLGRTACFSFPTCEMGASLCISQELAVDRAQHLAPFLTQLKFTMQGRSRYH